MTVELCQLSIGDGERKRDEMEGRWGGGGDSILCSSLMKDGLGSSTPTPASLMSPDALGQRE